MPLFVEAILSDFGPGMRRSGIQYDQPGFVPKGTEMPTVSIS
jgi:hypothetical protein